MTHGDSRVLDTACRLFRACSFGGSDTFDRLGRVCACGFGALRRAIAEQGVWEKMALRLWDLRMWERQHSWGEVWSVSRSDTSEHTETVKQAK